ncbi:ATP-dependent helicase HrpB [Paralimibaculum aggregatum]|uniref:ATP-dependent helicase HrpB n=1 Tax=Paralimibaculum aggregatum TaxID=3036245 RepID=A0ABQ6LNL6_9RHOB|nr:ATP-dependent helicase HrpB [Limibaculum sp. NKW23]GMG84796.1 ATP-dependent helicase HrpB [Limibaculum sp. NKW23]
MATPDPEPQPAAAAAPPDETAAAAPPAEAAPAALPDEAAPAALPIEAVLPALTAALRQGPNAVLAAPPGAGKTTRVPLALMGEPWAAQGRILMLEPRRIAARAAAERLAAQLGERPGGRVGYRIRGESRTGPATRIEVVTEGILTRLLQADPELPGIAAILFDEIHERSIHSDLGLALALEVQAGLRPGLRLLPMSATLDTAAFARLLGGAPVIESAGRAHAVETRWAGRPLPRSRGALETAMAETVLAALAETAAAPGGDILAFLPGAGEIRRTARLLAARAPELPVCPLYGALSFERQRAALAPDPQGRRRVVLATAIAETSLTVAGVRVVIDGGRARRQRVHPATGMGRLVTVPVSRAEAEQRRGRAGRLGPGLCYRLWSRAEEGALPAAAPAEILEADLAPLALEIAAWGAEPGRLAFLDPPPAPAMAEARALLAGLGALDAEGRITAHGRRLAERPAHPRLAHMLETAAAEGLAAEAALLAALLADRDPLPPGSGADLGLRLAALAGRGTPPGADAGVVARLREEARRLAPGARRPDPARARAAAGPLLARAYPDRVALRRSHEPGTEPRYLLSGGRGARIAAEDALAGQRLMVAAELEDTVPEATIRRAAPITEAELRAIHGPAIGWVSEARWSRREGRVVARQQERFGRIALDDRIWRDAPPEALGAALAEGIRDRGIAALPWGPAAARLRARMRWLAAQPGPLAARLPDWSDAGLLARLDAWLTPHLAGLRRIEDCARIDLAALLRADLGWELAEAAARAAPESFETPLGNRIAIDYDREIPTLSVRVQEMFGVTRHPSVGDPPIALVVELLSPARRPVQLTRDLPGFWAGSYAEMAKDMRAQYPRHPWPEDPAAAAPTRRARPRGGRR